MDITLHPNNKRAITGLLDYLISLKATGFQLQSDPGLTNPAGTGQFHSSGATTNRALIPWLGAVVFRNETGSSHSGITTHIGEQIIPTAPAASAWLPPDPSP